MTDNNNFVEDVLNEKIFAIKNLWCGKIYYDVYNTPVEDDKKHPEDNNLGLPRVFSELENLQKWAKKRGYVIPIYEREE